jgi:hypothetical protein
MTELSEATTMSTSCYDGPDGHVQTTLAHDDDSFGLPGAARGRLVVPGYATRSPGGHTGSQQVTP